MDELTEIGKRVRASLLAKYPEWSEHMNATELHELEAALPAPPGSQAGSLVVFTERGEDTWIRYAPAAMCYSVDSDEEMHVVLDGLLHDRILFVVITNGGEWVETTLVLAGEDVSVEPGHVARIVSWSGKWDRTINGPVND